MKSLCLLLLMIPATAFAAPIVRAVRVSPDGKLLAACVSDREHGGRLVVWDVETLQPKFARHDPIGISQIAFSPDSKRLVVAQNEAQVINASTGKVIGELSGHAKSVGAVAYTPDGSQIITAARDRLLRIFDAQSFNQLETIENTDITAGDIEISPDGKTMALANGARNLFHLFDFAKRKQTFVSEKMGSLVPDVEFSADGRFVATCCWVGPTNVYHVSDAKVRTRLDTYAHGVAFSADSKRLAVLASNSAYLFGLGDATSQQSEEIRGLVSKFRDEDYQVRNAATKSLKELGHITLPFLKVALQSEDPEVRIRCRRIAEYLSTTKSSVELKMDGRVRSGTFSRDGKRLFVGTEDGRVAVWDLNRRTLITYLSTSEAVSPSASRVDGVPAERQ